MLSPIMTTRGNGKRSYHARSCCPTVYSGFSPVPLSPMTAKCSVPGLLGSGIWPGGCGSAAAVAQQTSAATAHARIPGGTRRWLMSECSLAERAFHEVHDDVRVRIEEDHVPPDEPVFELFGQLRQGRKDLGRHRGDGDFVGVPAVDDELYVALVFLVDNLVLDLKAGSPGKDGAEQGPDEALHPRRQEIPRLGVLPPLLNELGQGALVGVDFLRCGLLRQLRDRVLQLLVQGHVLVHARQEILDDRRVGVDARGLFLGRGAGRRGQADQEGAEDRRTEGRQHGAAPCKSYAFSRGSCRTAARSRNHAPVTAASLPEAHPWTATSPEPDPP